MKRRYLKVIFICTLVCMIAAVCLGAAANPDVRMVENLLQTRTDIMQNVLYGSIPYEKGRQQLQQVEADTLLRKDLEALVKWRYTDLEPVLKMELISLKKESHIHDLTQYSAKIRWVYQQHTGQSHQIDEYSIGVMDCRGVPKLITLEIRK